MLKTRTILFAGVLMLTIPVAHVWTGKCIRIVDGDTIYVLHDGRPEKIRLDGIDCPEKRQAFGRKARHFTADLAFRKTVTVHPHGTDRYGRTLATVFVGNLNVNQALVRAGMAWWYQKSAPNDTSLGELEIEARSAHRGLWANAKNPTPPWEWRWQQRTRRHHKR
jgi:endonuclease YncB( thermonuclease family)